VALVVLEIVGPIEKDSRSVGDHVCISQASPSYQQEGDSGAVEATGEPARQKFRGLSPARHSAATFPGFVQEGAPEATAASRAKRQPAHMRSMSANVHSAVSRTSAMGPDHDEFTRLALRRQRMESIRNVVDEAYGKGFDALEAEIDLAMGIGQLALLRQDKQPKNPATFNAIAKLHAAVVLTAAEVIELLRGGFSAGATARWRTLYERAAIGHFISQAGEETAQRYLEHSPVQLFRLASALRETGDNSISDDDFAALEELVSTLTARHGSGFGGEYGWAGLSLSGRRTDKGNFAAIESRTPSAEERSIYRTASREVHATVDGPVVGSIPYVPHYLLFGPTPYQLAGAAQGTAKWVYFSAAAVVAHASGPPELHNMIERCRTLGEDVHSLLSEADDAVGDVLAQDLAAFTAPPPRDFDLGQRHSPEPPGRFDCDDL
jgi:hypothetical protein